MPLHLEGCPEFADPQVDRVGGQQHLRLQLPRRTDVEEPLEILALAASNTVQGKHIRAGADFFHGGSAQIVAELRMPGEDNRQLAVAIFDDFQQAFEVRERVTREVMRFVHKEDNGALTFFYSFTQVPLAFLALGRDA